MSSHADRGKRFLFDSRGRHIAVVMERQLFNRSGRNIGQYLPQYGIFVDRDGRYLGDVVRSDRLLYNLLSPYCTTNFGGQRTSNATVRAVQEDEQREDIGRIVGYIDLAPPLLEA